MSPYIIKLSTRLKGMASFTPLGEAIPAASGWDQPPVQWVPGLSRR